MTPYGYHNSEIAHISRSERENVREAIRQAKLMQRQAKQGATAAAPDSVSERVGRLHRLVGHVLPAWSLRHSQIHSH